MQRSMLHSQEKILLLDTTARFNNLTRGIKQATEISRVLLSLADDEASSHIISGLARRWNASHNVTRNLPAEILAGCFTFLPFCGRISASHVSSTWRTTSLGNPSVWSNITLHGKLRDEPALLRMALSRTGQRPVDLVYASKPDADGVVESCLAEHMHHVKTINWSSRQWITPFSLPAPLLEEFSAVNYTWDILEDFLGGRAGRLRKLHLNPGLHCLHTLQPSTSTRLPATCPALSTVASLSIRLPELPEHAASFSRLFQLCPSLESLTLCGLNRAHEDLLPIGPAPRTLQFLSLHCSSADYNVVQHYTEWNSGRTLRDVRIEMDSEPGPDFDIAGLFTGAESLTLMLDWRSGRVLLIAYPPPKGSLRFVSFDDDGEGAWAGAELVLRAQLDSDAVREICIPAQALEPFLEQGALHTLGKLQHLSLVLEPQAQYDWTPLAHLTDAEAACPQLEGVHLTVWPFEERKGFSPGPGAEHAHSLLTALMELDPAPQVPIRIQGFPQCALEDLPAIEGSGVRVEFKASRWY